MSNVSIFAGCVLIWGTTWLAITYQLGSVAPEVSVSHRFLFAALIVAAWCKWRGLSLLFTRSEHAALALMGVAMYGLSYVFVYHAERLFFKQPITARMALGSLFGIAGIALVYWPEFARLAQSHSVALGAAFTLLAVLISTAGGLLAQRNHQRKLHGWPTMAWSMGYGGLASLTVALALGRPYTVELSASYLLSLLYLSLLGSVIAFAGWLTLVGRIGVARASYVGVMAPVVALLVSTLLEGFIWHPLTAAGVTVSLVGNVLMLGRRNS